MKRKASLSSNIGGVVTPGYLDMLRNKHRNSNTPLEPVLVVMVDQAGNLAIGNLLEWDEDADEDIREAPLIYGPVSGDKVNGPDFAKAVHDFLDTKR